MGVAAVQGKACAPDWPQEAEHGRHKYRKIDNATARWVL